MFPNRIELPTYDPKKFVNREKEIALVYDIARDLANSKSVSKRTVIFQGERGTGKSWLLEHLAQTKLAEIPGVVRFPLDLKDYAGFDPILSVANILKKFREEIIGQRGGFGATLAEMSRQVMQEIRLLLSKQALVILVDTVYESDWNLLAPLEDYFLAPFAVEPRVLIVIAGRGRAYPWKTPELRLFAEFRKLGPFDEIKYTAEQLEKQGRKVSVEKAEEIHRQSGGNPLANYYLGQGASIDAVVNYILQVVTPENQKSVREYLEALCVLQAFDEERIPTMLAAYYDDPSYLTMSYAQAREVRDRLVKAAFARWNEDEGGFVIDSQTRRLVANYLKTDKPIQWQALHCAAYRLYQDWFKEYPRAKEHWQAQADHHKQQLTDAGYDPEQCPEKKTAITMPDRATVPMTV